MGQNQSHGPGDRFINDPGTIVDEALTGYVWSTPNVDLLPGFPDVRVVLRTDWKKQGVAVISGGGSGHEPGDVALVGKGALTAAVMGPIFSSPSVNSILKAIVTLTGPSGCLLIVKNYLGDRLNFGLAAKRARTEGFEVEEVYVSDDIAYSLISDHADVDFRQARGLAGGALLIKVAGAASEAGVDLKGIRDEVVALNSCMRTLAASMGRCTIPGHTHDMEQCYKMGIGIGLHGEPPPITNDTHTFSAKEIVAYLIDHLAGFLPEDDTPLCVMLNNLGSVPAIEMWLLTNEIRKKMLDSTFRTRFKLLIGPTAFMTCLNTNGISITICPLSELCEKRLCEETAARCWVPPVKIQAQIGLEIDMPDRLKSQPCFSSEEATASNPSEHSVVRSVLDQVLDVLENVEHDLDKLDEFSADGDCGRNVVLAVRSLRDSLKAGQLSLSHPGKFCLKVSNVLHDVPGAFMSILANYVANVSEHLFEEKTWNHYAVVNALKQCIDVVKKIGRVDEGMRSFLDALIPAIQVAATTEDMAVIAAAAQEGARRTKDVDKNAAGRAAYTHPRLLRGILDPGAVTIAVIFTTIADAIEGRTLSKIISQHSNVRTHDLEAEYTLGKLIGEGTYSTVHIAIEKKDGSENSRTREVAIKKAKSTSEESGILDFFKLDILDRVVILSWLLRPKKHIVRVIDIFFDAGSIQFVMELARGPTLKHWLDNKRYVPEGQAACLTYQILVAVKAIHDCGMVHRDLKPDNFMFLDSQASDLQLIDVCGTVRFSGVSPVKLQGTPLYAPPEAINLVKVATATGVCTLKSIAAAMASQLDKVSTGAWDMWSVGALLHEMLVGYIPFTGSTWVELSEHQAKPLMLDGEDSPWPQVSIDAKSVVTKLLAFDSSERLTVSDALAQDWIWKNSELSYRSVLKQISKSSHLGESAVPPKAPLLRSRSVELEETPKAPLTRRFKSFEGVAPMLFSHLLPDGWMTKTLILVRHGQAHHNIFEIEASEKAREQAKQLGLEGKKLDDHLKAARKSALKEIQDDDEFLDPALSHEGKAGAVKASQEIKCLVKRGIVMQPEVVFVSPLQRTLQTAALVFPKHPNTQVREYLKEKATGAKFDTARPYVEMAGRETFDFMDFQQLADFHAQRSSYLVVDLKEGDPELRCRAEGILSKLRSTKESVIGIVTHKGYLRELERGALGQTTAIGMGKGPGSEFDNTEVRIYDVELGPNGAARSTCKYHKASNIL